MRITGNPNHGYTGSNTLVVTPYAAELAGLFIEVRDTSGDLVDHMSKYELYGRLAQTAINAHKADSDLTLRTLTLEVLAAWSASEPIPHRRRAG
ncbi:MAG: hypothetical protein RQ936_11850 [Gammaproteobacteria bacterium]|nr:hypothetical protein [Gammaproteobacteria bacterium]